MSLHAAFLICLGCTVARQVRGGIIGSGSEREYPGCSTWPAYSIPRAEFEAANGSIPAGWKAAWEASENSEFPYSLAAVTEALLELKSLVLEDPWGFTANWAPGQHPCDFSQVVCNHHGVVTGVDLAGLASIVPTLVSAGGLGGAADGGDSGSLGKIRGRTGGDEDTGETEPESFLLGEMALPTLVLSRLPEGPAWQQWGSMSLQSVRLDNARLQESRKLPASWGDSGQLVEVSLAGCGLTGTLPGEWGSLAQLRRLDLSDNALSGSLPAEWSGMEALQALDASLSHGSRLAARLSGPLPNAWQSLRSLRSLDLWNQGVTGSLPASWAAMPALETLSLSGTLITGTLPGSWADMANLTTVHLANTGLEGQLPGSWGAMRNLTWVDFRSTRVAQGLPSSWKSFCKGKRASGVFPSFAYFPWSGVTELNNRRDAELNLCTVWRRRRRWQAALAVLVVVGVATWLRLRRQQLQWSHWGSKHSKNK